MSTTIKVGEEEFDFDFASPSNRDVMVIEKVTDLTYKEWAEKVQAGSITALTALVYMLKRRGNPKLRFDDVEFNLGEFGIEGEVEAEDKETPDPTDASSPTLSEDSGESDSTSSAGDI